MTATDKVELEQIATCDERTEWPGTIKNLDLGLERWPRQRDAKPPDTCPDCFGGGMGPPVKGKALPCPTCKGEKHAC